MRSLVGGDAKRDGRWGAERGVLYKFSAAVGAHWPESGHHPLVADFEVSGEAALVVTDDGRRRRSLPFSEPTRALAQ